MTINISKFDVSKYLKDEESIAAYLSATLEEGDPKLLLSAISDVAKARGMSKIALDSGLGRESLYKALNPEAKPRFETIFKVLNSLGVKINFNAINETDGQETKEKHPTKKSNNVVARVKRSKRTIAVRAKSAKKINKIK